MPYHEFLTSEGYNISQVIDFGSSFLRSGYNIFSEPGYLLPPISLDPISGNKSGTRLCEYTPALLQQDYVQNSHIDNCEMLVDFAKTSNFFDECKDATSNVPLPYWNFPKYPDSPLTILPPRHFNRNKLCELVTMLLSETNHGSVLLLPSSSAHLFSVGKSTGIVVDCGASQTSCTAVFEGYPIYNKEKVACFGGFDVTRMSKRLYPEINIRKEIFFGLTSTAKKFPISIATLTFADDIFLKGLKSNILEVFPDSCEWTRIKDNGSSSMCTLPDGHRLEVGSERYFLSEHLFTDQKDIIEKLKCAFNFQSGDYDQEKLLKSVHLPSMIEGVLFPYDHDLQESLKQTIVTCGGGFSSIKNINIRLKNELCSIRPEGSFQAFSHAEFSTSNCVSPSVNHSAWVGAAILSALPDLSAMSITRKEMDEFGPEKILEKKFP